MSAAFLSLVAWSRHLAYSSHDAAFSLLQWFRRVHGFSAALPEVSAKAATAAARRSMPLLQLPTPFESELEEVLAERGLKPRDARRLGQELAERLKSLSHTPQRGGFGPPSSTEPLPPRGGRLRGPELLAAREALEAGQILLMDERAVNAALGLPPPLRGDERHGNVLRGVFEGAASEGRAPAPQMQKIAPKYKTEPEILAYVVARLAPEYAVCRRVLHEAVRLLEAAGALPGAAAVEWRPREVLVHGAGVGAAVVATLEAFATSRSLLRLVALEPSHLRQVLGARVERAYRAKQQQQQQHVLSDRDEVSLTHQQQEQQQAGGGGDGAPRSRAVAGAADSGSEDRAARGRGMSGRQQLPAGPVVSWVQTLPPLTKAAGAQRRRYDLVIAPYQLTVLPTVEERERLVRELWDRCGDVLVLVEPGTPRGFAALAEARELLLGREGRKRAQLEAAAGATSGGSKSGSGQHRLPSHGGGGTDPRVAIKLRSAGAHVVAPCPHDGICPMQVVVGSKRHWCHFSQSLQLPAFMQRAMAPPGGKALGRNRALNVQDERFSYVILRRGPRPNFRVAISRDFDDGGAAGTSNLASSPPPPSRLPPRVVLNQIMLDRAAAAAVARVGAPSAAALAADGGVGPLPGTGIVDVSKRPAVSRRTPLFSASPPPQSSPADDSPQPTAAVPPQPPPPAPTVADSDMHPVGTLDVTVQPAMPAAAEAVSPPRPRARGGSSFGGAIGAGRVDGGGTGGGGADVGGEAGGGVEWASLGGKGDESSYADAAEEEAALEGADAGTIESEDDDGGDDSGDDSGDGSSSRRAPGLDAAVAELFMSHLAGPTALAANGGDGGGGGGGGDAVPAIGQRCRQGGVASADSTRVAPAAAAADRGFGAGAGALRQDLDLDMSLSSPCLHHSGAAASAAFPSYGSQQQQRLTRADVSSEEYDRVELQLVDRIYGSAAARVWPTAANRRDRADSTGPGSPGPTGASATRVGSVSADNGLEEEEEEEAAEVEEEFRQHVTARQADGHHLQQHQQQQEEEVEEEVEEEGSAPSPGPGTTTPATTSGALQAAEASSYVWGRLVRSPRLRGGHAILDMCVGPQHHYPDEGGDMGGEGANTTGNSSATSTVAAASAAGAVRTTGCVDGGVAVEADLCQPLSSGRPEGRLVQQVVAKSSRRGWMGAPAYRLARGLTWGDCWPDWYIRGHNTRETTAPPRITASAGRAVGLGWPVLKRLQLAACPSLFSLCFPFSFFAAHLVVVVVVVVGMGMGREFILG
ncbi:hypothetical protein VOLCADRAFT_120113 [Volvox carteri f. nagariensis]|uniref:Uncharacterized protein n=1 Tax=Volvox carteri f. nagariensis TaxID=3068 RepID=D8UKQ2_VOLCA|nr:uncharacterized protein VOLCADRAFT_120113 [Volvox carteri f. nagariensis]EFJ39694.1 hypothetical protein VOLCADRAFT_120113 [Volvox carteri f. nagariensis]|eukprot:XP_002959234.1 hypothetical protein VOLCADRAFT_120113 [Volvox carteri f. nagariensis]